MVITQIILTAIMLIALIVGTIYLLLDAYIWHNHFYVEDGDLYLIMGGGRYE